METINEYTKQANDFLAKHGILYASEFIKSGIHFDGDTEKRDIYNCTLKRGAKTLSIEFGQSINKSRLGLSAPNAYDLLTCITKNDPIDFENFCSEYGYSNDSISAKKTFKLVYAEYTKVIKFFSEVEIEELQEIQ